MSDKKPQVQKLIKKLDDNELDELLAQENVKKMIKKGKADG